MVLPDGQWGIGVARGSCRPDGLDNAAKRGLLDGQAKGGPAQSNSDRETSGYAGVETSTFYQARFGNFAGVKKQAVTVSRFEWTGESPVRPAGLVRQKLCVCFVLFSCPPPKTRVAPGSMMKG